MALKCLAQEITLRPPSPANYSNKWEKKLKWTRLENATTKWFVYVYFNFNCQRNKQKKKHGSWRVKSCPTVIMNQMSGRFSFRSSLSASLLVSKCYNSEFEMNWKQFEIKITSQVTTRFDRAFKSPERIIPINPGFNFSNAVVSI